MSAKHGDTTQDLGDLVRLLVEHPTGYIVACVNACEGLADPSVVPELMAAAKEIASFAQSWQPLTPGDIKRLTDAIAKAEGTE